jgi:hypothetical protein
VGLEVIQFEASHQENAATLWQTNQPNNLHMTVGNSENVGSNKMLSRHEFDTVCLLQGNTFQVHSYPHARYIHSIFLTL